ncbi:MAG: transposase [Oscillibacter sp.]|nr:transposase [Oscillibacter sp.]
MKQQAAESYLSGQMSIGAVCKKYQLRSRSQLEQWVMQKGGSIDHGIL